MSRIDSLESYMRSKPEKQMCRGPDPFVLWDSKNHEDLDMALNQACSMKCSQCGFYRKEEQAPFTQVIDNQLGGHS